MSIPDETVPTAAAGRLLQALDDLYDLHPGFFEHGELGLLASVPRNEPERGESCDVDLDIISADHPGRGWAGAALGLLTALADTEGASVFAAAYASEGRAEDPADPWSEPSRDDGTLTQPELEAFYGRHGFGIVARSGGLTFMRREPRGLSAARRAELDRVLGGGLPAWKGPPQGHEPSAGWTAGRPGGR